LLAVATAGEKVRYERRARGWTQEELAAKAGIALASVSRIETGHNEPRITSLRRIAKAFGLEPRDLLDD
jgi:HTH-type transcriptional regulator/antitoxin HipB